MRQGLSQPRQARKMSKHSIRIAIAMWVVIIPGFSPLKTICAPIQALAAKRNRAKAAVIGMEGLFRHCHCAMMKVAKVSSPRGREVSRLRYSTQVCVGLNSLRTDSRVMLAGSIPCLAARLRYFSISSLLTSIWSALVGGIKQPQQVGQSGQPMPEPVARTMAPTKMSNINATLAAAATF